MARLSIERTWFQILCCHVEPQESTFSLPSCLNEYLDIDSGGYLCTNHLCALIATLLNASSEVFDWLDMTESKVY